MKSTTIYMYVVAFLMTIAAYTQGGFNNVITGLLAGGKMLIISTPLILLAMVVAGLIQVIVSQELVENWIGKEAGIKGILLAGLAGAIIPGGPYVYYPIAVSFFIAGAGIGPIMTFVTAKNLWSLSRIPFEMALLGPKITFTRYIITLIFPVIVGIMANAIYSKYSNNIRCWILNQDNRSEE